MKKIVLAILSIGTLALSTSCKKECVCKIMVDDKVVDSAIVGEMKKEECDTFFWAVPADSHYYCEQN